MFLPPQRCVQQARARIGRPCYGGGSVATMVADDADLKRAPIWFSLRGNPEQAGDGCDLTPDVASVDVSNLSSSDHCHRLDTSERSSNRLEASAPEQQFGLTRREPIRSRRALTFGTITNAAQAVGDASEATIPVTFDMTVERRRAAGRHRSDHALFDAPEMSGVRSVVTLAVKADDDRQVRAPAERSIRAASR